MLKISLLASSAVAQLPHPTLPTMWISETNEPGMGDGFESYYFVDQPTKTNPSALWSNYTGCQRLIYDDGTEINNKRFLLKCDAVDCCTEDQDGNQVEFQIPNVHPEAAAKNFTVTHNVSLTTEYDETVTTDEWHWQTLRDSEEWHVYTTNCSSCVNNVQLYRWKVRALTEEVNIDYKNFQGIPESQRAEFLSTFQIPKQCQGPQVLRCDDYRAKGLLRPAFVSPAEKMMAFHKRTAEVKQP